MGIQTPFSESHPDIASEWDVGRNSFDPSSVSRGSNAKAWWLCPQGHSFEARVHKRAIGQGCPYCSGRRVLVGLNDLATVDPAIAAEWHPSKNAVGPETVTAGSGVKRWWVCVEGHEYEASVNSRTSGTGCPYCTNRLVLSGWNDLASQRPEVAAEWCVESNGSEASEALVTATAVAWWQCRLGHRWKVSVRSRTLHKSGCPYCSGRLAVSGVSDLATTFPEVARQWHPTRNAKSATEAMPRSAKVVWWLCDEGHTYRARIASRTRMGSGCPQCSGREVIRGVNDLMSVNPALATEWSERNRRSPVDVKPMSDYRAYWRCAKGHEWRAAVGSRHNLRSGCPSCAQTGFSPARAALLYLLTHERLQAFKVGITNYGTSRIEQFEEMGWSETYRLYHRDGGVIKAAEAELLRWLRVDLGLKQALSPGQVPIGGATETFTLGAVTKNQVTEKMLAFLAVAEQAA